jgi:hypothetical protein
MNVNASPKWYRNTTEIECINAWHGKPTQVKRNEKNVTVKRTERTSREWQQVPREIPNRTP